MLYKFINENTIEPQPSILTLTKEVQETVIVDEEEQTQIREVEFLIVNPSENDLRLAGYKNLIEGEYELPENNYYTISSKYVDGNVILKEYTVTPLSDEEIAQLQQEQQQELEEMQAQEAEQESIREQQAQINAELEQQALIERRQADFNNNFFNTSLGYVRKEVNMADGSTKSFLYDLLPTITNAVLKGQQVQLIVYDEPQSYESDVDYVALQRQVIATAQFIQECMEEVSREFTGA